MGKKMEIKRKTEEEIRKIKEEMARRTIRMKNADREKLRRSHALCQLVDKIGFAPLFYTDYDDEKRSRYNGRKFTVIRKIEEPEWGIEIEDLPLYEIRFIDKTTMLAHPIEICDFEI